MKRILKVMFCRVSEYFVSIMGFVCVLMDAEGF